MEEAPYHEFLLLSIENPMLDISVTLTSEDLLEKYGLKMANAVLATPQTMPIYDEIWNMPNRKTTPGGSSLNTVRAANFMLKNRLRGKCGFFGCIGKDEFGRTVETELEKSGVHSLLYKTDEEKTASCAVLVYNNERSLCCNLAACLKYPTSHLKENL